MTEHHPPTATRARRTLLARNESGAAMVEFALVVGIFVMVLYGLIYYGMALTTKQRVTNAAAEGARAAVGAASDADAQTIAQNRVLALLGTPNGRYTVTPVAAPCNVATPGGAKCISVTIKYDWENHPAVPAAPGLNLAPVPSLASTAVVQYSA